MDLHTILKIIGVVALVSLVLSALILAVAIRKLRKIRVPVNADFFTAVRAVPLSLVVGIDLLDLALDSFSAPIIWFILNRSGLQALRNVAAVEALIPISGPIPTLTIAWFAARLFKLGKPYDPNIIEAEQIGPNAWAPRR
ncbi:MAG TPA: hypothetical protein VH988_00885 [Thermoanaerobaculia bacterium]|jgi:hypothetical protein|nr:hypothetical protein [Thermoanaerobaculia bacterium]